MKNESATTSKMPRPLADWLILGIVSILAVGAVVWATEGLKHYGLALFVGVPMGMALLTALLYGHNRIGSFRGVLWRTLAAMPLTVLWMLLCRVEGMGCIIMAMFLVAGAIVLGLLIVWITGWLVKAAGKRDKLRCVLLLALPFSLQWESTHHEAAPMLHQNTSIEVDAPPDVVWRYIPSFPAISEPPEGWLERSIAYPISSEIDGSGVGARRRCILSTGVMPEVVTAWEPGKLLEFVVMETPLAMVESNPLGEAADTPHVHGYFQARRGRFTLTALPSGGTRIDGDSWFTHALWPQWYWAPLTQRTVRSIHLRVLQHVKHLAEQDAARVIH